MADYITNQSEVFTISSVSSLEKAIGSTRFLLDVSRDVEFQMRLEEYLEKLDRNNAGDLESELKVWTGFFRFMPNDAGGIMSHINTEMEKEHGCSLHYWTQIKGQTAQIEHLIKDLQRFRMLCKDFKLRDWEYNCLTSNFLVEKPRGLTMDGNRFFITTKMVKKLRICQVTYPVIELTDKYEPLENFLLYEGGGFHDTFKLGSTVVQVASINDRSIFHDKAVSIKAGSEIRGYSTRVVSYKSQMSLNFSPIVREVTDFDACNADVAEIKLLGRVLSCLKHMSNYNSDEAQFGVIDNLYKVGCDNFIVAKSPTIDEIIHMWPPNDLVLVDLSQVSDLPLIFGTGISTIDQIH
jgi:hypothetical protein